MSVPTRETRFTPEGEFSWVAAVARTLGLWTLSYAVLALLMFAAGAGLIPGRRPDSALVEPGYLLIAWVGLQGFYPVFLRADASDDDYRVQSPRFLRLLLLSQATGLVLLAALLTPLVGIGSDVHTAGSLIAGIPEDPTAWLTFYGYAVGMAAWPVAAGLFMMRMSARWETLFVGAAVGLPLFLLALLGGLLVAVFRMLDPGADPGSLLVLFGGYGLSGAAVYVLLLLWYRASVAREPLGPPPARWGPFVPAVTATCAPPSHQPRQSHQSHQSYQSYRPHQPAPSHDPSQPAHQAQQAQQAQQYVPPRPPVAVGPIPWGSFLLGALIVWLLLGALVTSGLWLVGLSGPAGADLAPPGLTAFAVVAMVAAGPLSLIAVHRPGTGLRLGHRRLHRATWASLGVGVGVLVLALPLWALLGLLPQTWWRPPLGAPVLDSVIAVLFLLGTTFGVHAGALLMRRGAVRGAWSRLAGISGWVLSAATVLCALLFASVWIEAIVTADDSLRLGIVLFAGIGALIGWIAHLLACRVPAPVNAPQPSSPPAVDHIRSDIDVTGTTYPSPYRSEPPRRHP